MVFGLSQVRAGLGEDGDGTLAEDDSELEEVGIPTALTAARWSPLLQL